MPKHGIYVEEPDNQDKRTAPQKDSGGNGKDAELRAIVDQLFAERGVGWATPGDSVLPAVEIKIDDWEQIENHYEFNAGNHEIEVGKAYEVSIEGETKILTCEEYYDLPFMQFRTCRSQEIQFWYSESELLIRIAGSQHPIVDMTISICEPSIVHPVATPFAHDAVLRLVEIDNATARAELIGGDISAATERALRGEPVDVFVILCLGNEPRNMITIQTSALSMFVEYGDEIYCMINVLCDIFAWDVEYTIHALCRWDEADGITVTEYLREG